MANQCLDCGTNLSDAEVTFGATRCQACDSVQIRALPSLRPPPTGDRLSGRRTYAQTSRPSQAESAGEGIAKNFAGSVIGVGISVGIGAIIAALCYTDLGERIQRQNEAADSPSSAVLSEEFGKRTIFDLRVGDCFSESASDALVADVTVVPCESPSARVRVTKLFTVPGDGQYPANSYFDDQFEQNCPLRDDFYLYPTNESWGEGDRTITCLRSVR